MGSSEVERVLGTTKIQTIYNTAKILANPHDYVLKDRALFYKNNTFTGAFNVFVKSNNTELDLATRLGGTNATDYMELNPDLKIPNICSYDQTGLQNLCMLMNNCGYCGTFIKYDDLRVNEEALLTDLGLRYPAFTTPTTNPSLINALENQGFLKALFTLLEKCYSKSSLIPNLFYLNTKFYNRSLDDMENIVFAKEALARNICPLLQTLWEFNNMDTSTVYAEPCESRSMLGSINVLFYKPALSFPKEAVESMLFSKFPELGADVYKIGLSYAIVYGAEILYHLSKIDDPAVVEVLTDLLSSTYQEDSFCSKFLYSFSPSGELVINSNIKSCFDDDTLLRFTNFRNLLASLLKAPELNTNPLSDLEFYALPIMFAKLIMSMHSYAFQVSRIKHAMFLYNEAKSKGLIDKDSAIRHCMPGTGMGSGDPDDDEDDDYYDDNDEFLDLSLDSYDGADDSLGSFADSEKEVTKKRKETPSMLSPMDALKSDLAKSKSKYSFDISYVKTETGNKEDYNTIASNIKMLTRVLTKQIKEIKTYNTGGKQGGLLTGKLDKKNLYKYKTDPHIFCNNSYKLKEMDLAFGCILDQSGSMSGEKVKNGRIVMIMLHEVLTSLSINHSIIGHTSDGFHQSKIFKYFQFKEENTFTLSKPYSLAQARAHCGNCDSASLYYMESCMKHVKNKDKIVIIFSDGQPTECTDDELKQQVRHMEKNGIHVIGVGINFESIKEYYPDNANGRNLQEMTNIVVSILKRYVLEKKEV